MNSTRQSSGALSDSSAASSSHCYADIENGSNFNLITPHYQTKTASASSLRTKRNSSNVRGLAVASLVLSSLCLVCLGLFCYWFVFISDGEFPFHSSRRADKKSEVCLPCLQVSPNPLENSPSDLWGELDVRHDDQNDTDICCATNTAQYAALFKLILQRQEEVKKLADALDTDENNAEAPQKDVPENHSTRASQPVSAHVVFKPMLNEKSGTEADSRQHWKSPTESPKSHVKHGLKFHHNRIYVQSPGLYFIYCQILYSPSYSSSDGPTLVSNYVKRHSILRPATSSILLKSRHTQYDASQDRHSSYVGGVFELYRGDTLYVQVSRPELVSYDDVATFFGLFKLGE